MKFRALQENLRKVLWQRIDARELSGLHLAQQTGFRQAHISNFLNRKRGLSLEGMDKILSAQRLSILDLLDPAEINRRASIPPPSDDVSQFVLLTDASIAATQSWIRAMHIREMVKFRKSFLQRLRPETQDRQGKWERFVLIRVNATEAACMFPRIRPGALLLLDRHYNSLKPYRRGELNLYAVLRNRTCSVRYVEDMVGHLLLRSHHPSSRIEVLPVAEGKKPGDYLVGRVCHIAHEV